MDTEKIRIIAKKYGWKEIDHQEFTKMISFYRKGDNTRINVYYSTGTVGTCLNHPKHGKTQLFRRNVNIEFMEQIFRKPRIHTKSYEPYHGYRKRIHA